MLIVISGAFESEAARRRSSSRRTKTTQVSRSKKKSRVRSSSRKSRSSKKRYTRSRGRRTATRNVWRPFRNFETSARPTISHITNDSVASLKRKSAAGNPEAQYLLGCSYFENKVRNTPSDSAIIYAADYWRQSAESGHPVGMGDYAYCLRTGRGVRPDTLKAVEWYVKSLVTGNNQLLRLVKQNADRGSGMDAFIMSRTVSERPSLGDKNGKSATEYYAIAINSAFPHALIEEARRAIDNGEYERALTCYRSIPSPDDDTISEMLELLSTMGNTDESILISLASTDFPEAQLALAKHYLTQNRPTEAAKWLKEAAQNGNDQALDYYVRLLVSGENNIKRDYMQAYNWLDVRAEENDSLSLDRLAASIGDAAFEPFVDGTILLRAEKYREAMPFFEKSYHLDGDGAESLYLLCLAKTDRKAKADKRLKELVKQGAPLAAYAWAILKPKEAIKTLQPAADAGSITAMDYLGTLLARQGKYPQAYKYLVLADEAGILSPEGAKALSESMEHTDNH